MQPFVICIPEHLNAYIPIVARQFTPIRAVIAAFADHYLLSGIAEIEITFPDKSFSSLIHHYPWLFIIFGRLPITAFFTIHGQLRCITCSQFLTGRSNVEYPFGAWLRPPAAVCL